MPPKRKTAKDKLVEKQAEKQPEQPGNVPSVSVTPKEDPQP